MTLIKAIGAVSIVICIGWGAWAIGRTIRMNQKLHACPGAMRFYWALVELHEKEQVEKIRQQYSVSAASRYIKQSPPWNEAARGRARRPY